MERGNNEMFGSVVVQGELDDTELIFFHGHVHICSCTTVSQTLFRDFPFWFFVLATIMKCDLAIRF